MKISSPKEVIKLLLHAKENIVYACDSNLIYSSLTIYLSLTFSNIYIYLKNSNKCKYPREIFPYILNTNKGDADFQGHMS